MPQRAGGWLDERMNATQDLERSAQASLADWLREAARWDLFATYTWDPAKATPPRSGEQVLSEVTRFYARVERGRGSTLKAVTFAEPHRSGWWHGHGLVELPAGTQRGDIERLHGGWFSRKGYVRFEVPQSDNAVSRYLSKYLTKTRADWRFYPDPLPPAQGMMWRNGCS